MEEHLFRFLRCILGRFLKPHPVVRKRNERKQVLAVNNKGAEIEQLTCDYLLSKGLQLLQRNFLSRYGEIDLIMQDDDTVVFIEVRYRKNSHYGGAAASVTRAKQQRIIKTALSYQHYTVEQSMRFDVVAVEGTPPKIEWIKNAFLGF
jgi:putative endonuclease